MKVLFIGGTGNISTACVREAYARGFEVHVLTRGKTDADLPEGVKMIEADFEKPASFRQAVRGHTFDIVANFIAFEPADVERDMELFGDSIGQYLFISSASCYQKPPGHPVITESTPLANPFWDYSRNKIACEDALVKGYREWGFPATIIRPSLTYQYVIPVIFGAWREYTIIDRMKRGEPVIVHGDGTSVWTITHSEDFAKGFVGLFGHQQAIGHAFHITSDELLTWDQIYQAVAAAAGVEARIVHIASDFIAAMAPQRAGTLLGDKAYSAIFDNSKIKTFVPDFKATIPFSVGIRRTLKWFETDPGRMVINEESNRLMDRILEAYDGKGS
jgi:nucleoside-diphosphate-sugar epimerase